MSHREVNCSKLINPHFIGVLAFIGINYAVFVGEFLFGRSPTWMIPVLIAFHIFFGMLLWSMIRSIISDPGRVPIYWGFFAEESDNRKRRYCLLCHSFKPERYLLHNVGVIIALLVLDVFSIWTIIARG